MIINYFAMNKSYINFVVTHLYIFANNLYDLQIKLLDWGSREVNVTQKTIDDL